jgi:nicotinamidase-related amidase
MLDAQNCCLVVMDVQGKLASIVSEKEALVKNIRILIQAAKILSIPIVWCEQRPEALGPTVQEIAELLTGLSPVTKTSFSGCDEDGFIDALENYDKGEIILCGIEAHICIYQTTVDLLENDYQVDVMVDAISSRTAENKQIAIERMRSEGANIGSVEMLLFELLGTADHPKFREIAKLIK